MATITLENMQFYAHHGCFAEERKVGTNFSVTVTFSYDATIAAATDNLEQAVNYVTSWGEFESDYDEINAHGESISVVAQKSTAYRCYAEDGKGGEKLITFRIHVSELSAYPEGASIMADGTYNNRTSVNAEVNVPTTLTVNTNAAVGANLTYKWTMGPLNDSGWWPLEQGADSTTNTLTVTPAQSARYLCTVTDQYDNQALCYFYVNVDGLTFTTNHGTPTLVGDNLYEIHVPATIGEETTLTTQAGRGSTRRSVHTPAASSGWRKLRGNAEIACRTTGSHA